MNAECKMCKIAFVNANRCKTVSEFRRKFSASWSHLQYEGSLQATYRQIGLKHRTANNFWTFQRCLKAARQCKTVLEFRTSYPNAVKAARRSKWINKIYETANLKPHYAEDWTFKRCKAEAAKFSTRSEFYKGSSAYYSASRKGWLDRICKHMKPQGTYTLRKLYAFEYSDKSVYVGLTYNYDRRYAHHMKFTKILKSKRREFTQRFVTFDKLYSAIQAGRQEAALIDWYRTRGWTILNTNKAGGLGGNIIKWTLETCKKEARRYRTKKDFLKACPAALVTARKRGWLEKICAHMVRLRRQRWTDKQLRGLIKKYKTNGNFRNKQNGAYQVALKRGLLATH